MLLIANAWHKEMGTRNVKNCQDIRQPYVGQLTWYWEFMRIRSCVFGIPSADIPFLFASPPGSQTAAPPDACLSLSTLPALSPPSYLAGKGRSLQTWSGAWPGSLELRKLWARFFNLLLLLVYIVVIITCVVLQHQSINQNICERMRTSLQRCALSLSWSTCFLPLSSQPLLASLINLGTLWWVC